MRLILFLFCCSALFVSFTSPQPEPSSIKKDSLPEITDDPDFDGDIYHGLTCNDLENKKVIWELFEQNSDGNSVIDTSNLLIVKGHFLDNNSAQTLIWVEGYSMPSCGNGCNPFMLFDCSKNVEMIFSSTTGVFSKDGVRDLNNDGVLEIISKNDICRMGECHSEYQIFNLKDTVQHFLYQAHSYSLIDIDSWGDNYAGYFKTGDTLDVAISQELIDPGGNNVFEIKQIRTVKTFNGGEAVADIVKNEIVKTDTLLFQLRK